MYLEWILDKSIYSLQAKLWTHNDIHYSCYFNKKVVGHSRSTLCVLYIRQKYLVMSTNIQETN